jgi:flavin-dependent dehydrogenase
VPQCNFAGGALIGCAAGFVNAARVHQGVHTAMKSGMLAADAAFGELAREGAAAAGPLHMAAYGRSLKDSWAMAELKAVRACLPAVMRKSCTVALLGVANAACIPQGWLANVVLLAHANIACHAPV